MTGHEERAIGRFRFRLGALLALRYAVAGLTAWAFLWGTAVLALRAAAGVPRPALLWGLAAAPLALLPALLLAWRRLPSRSAVRALLDRHSRCGGLLMAGAEVPLEGWQESLPELAPPRLRWRGRRAWGLLAGSAAFVGLGFLLPQSLADLGGGPRLEVGREVEKLSGQVEVLKEEAVLEPHRAEALKQKLQQLRQEALGREPVKTLEALDHLQDLVQKSARDGAESMAKKAEDAARAEALADRLAKKRKKMDAKTLAEGMSQLAALTRQSAAEAGLLDKHLDTEALNALRSGALDARALGRLGTALGECKGEMMKRLGRLRKAGLIDDELLQRCEGACQCDGKDLEEFLRKNCSGKLCDALCEGERPGRGGVTRGPGAAKLTWKEESKADGVKFKEEALPAADLEALKKSKLAGLSTAAPKVGEGKGRPVGSGALAGAAAGGGSSSAAVVLPRHRAAVGRYFERPAK
jgi:hypothetical protein